MKIQVMSALALAGIFCFSHANAQSGAGWPGGFDGKLEPVDLVWSIVSSGQPHHRGLAVDFKLALIEEGRMLVEEETMNGLPLDQTEDERRANRTNAKIHIPFDFSDTAQNDPAGLEDLVDHAASLLERYRVPLANGVAAEASCSGLRPGTEWTARATDARCEEVTEMTYRCTMTDSPSGALWLRAESDHRAVDADLATYCG